MSRYQYDPTTEELTLIAGNSYQKFIAPIESSPTKTSHAKGSYLIYGSVLYEVTTAISSGGTIVVYPTSGYNVKEAATLEEQIASVKQALTNEAVTRSKVGAHNLLPMSLAWIKANNTQGTWSGNTYTITSGNGSVVYVVNTDGNTINGINVTATGTRSGLASLILAKTDFGDTALTYDNPTANGYIISGGENADAYCAVTYSAVNQLIYIRLDVSSTINNKRIYPMIRLATDPNTEYEPYAPTNQDLVGVIPTMTKNGAHNLLPITASTEYKNGVTFTVNSNGTISASGTAGAVNPSANAYFEFSTGNSFGLNGSIYSFDGSNHRDGYILTDGVNASSSSYYTMIQADGTAYIVVIAGQTVNLTFKPMLRLDTDLSDEFSPYAMTNRELTENKVDNTTLVNLSSHNLMINKGATQIIDTVTFTVNATGSITLSASAPTTEQVRFCISGYENDYVVASKLGLAPNVPYIISGSPNSKITLRLSSGGNWPSYGTNGIEQEFTIPNATNTYRFEIVIDSGFNPNGLTVYPMIRLASDLDNTYKPYAMTNRDLSFPTSGSISSYGESNITRLRGSYVKIGSNTVIVTGVWNGSAKNVDTILTMPKGLRPKVRTIGSGSMMLSSYSYAEYAIDTDGKLAQAQSSSAGTGGSFTIIYEI